MSPTQSQSSSVCRTCLTLLLVPLALLLRLKNTSMPPYSPAQQSLVHTTITVGPSNGICLTLPCPSCLLTVCTSQFSSAISLLPPRKSTVIYSAPPDHPSLSTE